MSQTLPRIGLTAGVAGLRPLTPVVAPVGPAEEAAVDRPFTIGSSASSEHPPVVEVAIPVYNEELMLEASTRRLRAYLDESFPFETAIRIVDNASTDATWEIATRLASALPGVSALHLDQKGKGRAVRAAWSSSSAQIVCYMDVDLSTDLGGLLPLVAPLLSGHSDVSIGSRFASGAHVLPASAVKPCPTSTGSCSGAPSATSSPMRPVGSRRPGRDSGTPASLSARRTLVLRHGVPRVGGTKWVSHPRGSGGLGGRCRLPSEHLRRGQGGPARRGPSHPKSSHW